MFHSIHYRLLCRSFSAMVASLALMLSAGAAAQGDFFIIPVPVDKNVSAADVVELRRTSIPANSLRGLRRVTIDGLETGGDFTTRTGELLVVNALQVLPLTRGEGEVEIELVQDSRTRQSWVVPRSGMTRLSFSPGILIGPGFIVRIRNLSADTALRVDMFGYLSEAP